MPYDLESKLVIGISSRSLFDLEKENKVYENRGLDAFQQYQIKNEEKIVPIAGAILRGDPSDYISPNE